MYFWIVLYILFCGIGAKYLTEDRSAESVIPLLIATLTLIPLAQEGEGYAMLAATLFTMASLPLWVLYWHVSEEDEPVTQDP